ncbi:ROK family transcriptional regulator [Corynebacterium lizhenjunii]|uniref:ROK family transcriptional regulator n=1 Tax=Corynebacterium lizhenjunii TaxID=2709394 RepID=UPI0013EC65AF|nr:ROK family transcriptional regulator [Corynebacterium lizhenjunii]
MNRIGPVFSRPESPAAKCLHLVRFHTIITRSELVEASGLSQPTVTRAVASLLEADLLQERTDLTRSRGRGRPTIPLVLGDSDRMLAGIAIGTTSTHIALFDTRGRALREGDFPTPVAELTTEDFIQHIMAGINRLVSGIELRLSSVGVTTSGFVNDHGLVYAPNLGWRGMDIAARLQFQFGVPVTVTSAVPAILAAETQAAPLDDTSRALVLFADDSLGAALADTSGVRQVPLPNLDGRRPDATLVNSAIAQQQATADPRTVLDRRARQLGALAALLIHQHQPETVVIAGSAFYGDPPAPKLFAAAARTTAAALGTSVDDVDLRMIPNHREIVRAIARAVALDPLLRAPLSLAA